MTEPRDIRLKRLRIRSWRRGTREMDMILGPFFDQASESLSDAQLDAYERLLDENDQDLYTWFSGQIARPSQHAEIIQSIEQVRENGI